MNSFRLRFVIFTFLFFVTLIISCTKIVTTDIGAGLIPPVDGIITKDTIVEVITKNTGEDTISVGISDDHVLGYTDDRIFGKTTASVNFQIAPVTYPVYFGMPKDSIILDSVVLCLKYKGFWGDSMPPVKLRVYSIDPEVIFANDSAYNNTISFQKGREITEFNTAKDIDIRRLDDIDTTAKVYNEPVTNQLRVRLDNSFGRQLIDYDSAKVYQNDETFYNYLRGLIVEPETTGNALILVNLQDTTTHLSFYYHNKSGDTLTKRFAPDVATSASSNTILRDYQGTDIPSFLSGAGPNDSLIFMQTSPGGMLATIKIPAIENLSNRIVHRAELLMYQAPDPFSNSDALFTPPNLFLAAYANDSVNYSFAVPYDVAFFGNTINNLAQFGVYPIKDPKTTNNTYYYNFDITRYVQGIITRKDPLYNLILSAPYNQTIYPVRGTIYPIPIASPSLNTVGIGRVRLGGGSNSNYKMKLHIVYSEP